MIDLPNRILKLEESNRNDISHTIAFCLRSWQAYRFLEHTAETRLFLQRANHAAIAAYRRNTAHIRLYVLTIFIAIESRHYDSANEMLDKAMAYKSYLRANQPLYYGCLCFLYAYLEINQKRARSAKKYRKLLSDHVKAAKPSLHYAVMQGLLHLAAGEFPEAYSNLNEAFRAGGNSIFLYEGLFRYYKTAKGGPEGMSVLPVLIYAAQRGADITGVATKYAQTLSAAISADPESGEMLYATCRYAPLLKDICAHHISNNDMSPKAFAFYREAERKQVYTSGLFDALIEASYQNGATSINHYPMQQFLQTERELPQGLAVYIYHFLLTDPAHSDILPNHQNKILKLGARLIKSGVTSRQANSIYFFLWEKCRQLGISGADLNKAEEILRENLTKFELHTEKNSAARFIYITEPEKRGMTVCEIKNDNPIIIEAVTAQAGYTCLGAGQRAILDEEITILPMVEQASPELYMHFFQKGDRRFHLLAYLANYFLQMDEPPKEAQAVFEALLLEKSISKPYTMKILARLGQIHYNEQSFDEALKFYGRVDDNALNFPAQILSVYLETGEHARAAKLLAAKHVFMDNDTLFEAITKLAPHAAATEEEVLPAIGYRLLTSGYFSEELLEMVLSRYVASYSEWATLSKLLDEDNRTSENLDIRVLESALAMNLFDRTSQQAFTRLSRRTPDTAHTLLSDFIELATYEMLVNFTKPEYDVITILEKTDANILLTWALAGIFIKYNITTFKSEEIIRAAIAASESEGIFFPIFKENKLTPIPFIEKFQPFLYQSLPKKDCRLYYHMNGESVFKSMPMQYVRYGLYVAAVPMFYNEELTYYFSEERPTGSITTKQQTITNKKPFVHENADDNFFTINNAIIYEQMFKHEQVEKLISRLVKDTLPVRARLI